MPDVIVIGGGAAGLMCAIEAGKRGRKVLALEHAERLGKKILISGGGRCNFTNFNAGPENYLSIQPHFCKSALARYTPADFLALVDKHHIAWHEKKLGQLFCDISSKQIVELLQRECDAAQVEIRLNCRVENIQKQERFSVETNEGPLRCDSLVVATGGLSFPKIGATDFGYRLAEQFGLKMSAPRPGLVPLLFGAEDQASFGNLSGISIEVNTSRGGGQFRENLLFTHRGLSGPAILQISSFGEENGVVSIDLLPNKSAEEIFSEHRNSSKELKNVLSQHLPQRFVEQWCQRFAPSKPMHRFPKLELQEISRHLHDWQMGPHGTEGYAKAEVTLGGVDPGELSSKTMEARRVPGLYFVGEIVDVTGWLGGFNFQWAWASGHAAGQFV